MLGKIKCIKQLGFGFIRPEGGGDDIYFHASWVIDKKFDELKEGDQVQFDLSENAQGSTAENISLI